MKRIYVCVVALWIGGCALPMAPSDVIKTGTKIAGTTKQQPAEAARCVARNLEREKHHVTSSDRPGEAPGTVELIVRGHGEATFTMSVWMFEPSAGSSKFTVHVATYLPNTVPEEYVKNAAGPC
jgi:hypothetical protein